MQSYGGIVCLRNDNPSNIIIQSPVTLSHSMHSNNLNEFQQVKGQAMSLFNRGEYFEAITEFKSALGMIEDAKLIVSINSKIA